MKTADKICWYLFLLYMGSIIIVGLYSIAQGIQEDSMRVLTPYGGRADFYLDIMRDY